MSNVNYSFSYNYNETPKKPTKPVEEELFCFDTSWHYKLPNQQTLLSNRHNGQKTILPDQLFFALSYCQEFKTFGQHANEIIKKIPELKNNHSNIVQSLNDFKNKGFAVSSKDFLNSIKKLQPMPNRSESSVVCVMTCDRPEALERVLNSILNDCGNSKESTFHVIDDSRKTASKTANQKIIDSINTNTSDFHFNYLGDQEQLNLIEKITRKLPQHEQAVKFLIGRPEDPTIATHGRVTNLALLLSVGKKLIIVADDVLCKVHDAPYKSFSAFEISSSSRYAEFYDQNEEWSQYARIENQDPLEQFNYFLGKSISEAITTIGSEKPDILRLRSEEVPDVTSDSPILITACGTYGDPGMTSNAWLYNLKGESRKRLLTSEEHYLFCKQHRNNWLGRKHYHFSPRVTLMSAITGMENSALIPPLFPMFRNEDLLLGDMINIISPKAVALDFPWALPHLPLETRAWKNDSINQPSEMGFLYFTSNYLRKQVRHIQAHSPVDRLQAIADILIDLANASGKQLKETLLHETLSLRSFRIKQFQEILADKTLPDYWLKDINTAKTCYLDAFSEEVDFLPIDLPESSSDEQQLLLAAKYWQDYARAINAWPDIRSVAGELN